MEKRIAIVCSLLLALGGVANAVTLWTGTVDNDFNNGGNWNPSVPWPPASLTEEMNINLTANVNVSASFQCGMLKFKGAAGIVTTVNQNVDVILITQKAGSSELLSLANGACAGSMYQSAGTVYVRQSTTNGLTTPNENGQLRLVQNAAGSGH
ncbi:MAG: hypothetical protein MUP14_01220, partial [Dehalococcoidia bacterium]|nr:hypothetical protein [Dehalococcoidia bacterium]